MERNGSRDELEPSDWSADGVELYGIGGTQLGPTEVY